MTRKVRCPACEEGARPQQVDQILWGNKTSPACSLCRGPMVFDHAQTQWVATSDLVYKYPREIREEVAAAYRLDGFGAANTCYADFCSHCERPMTSSGSFSIGVHGVMQTHQCNRLWCNRKKHWENLRTWLAKWLRGMASSVDV